MHLFQLMFGRVPVPTLMLCEVVHRNLLLNVSFLPIRDTLESQSLNSKSDDGEVIVCGETNGLSGLRRELRSFSLKWTVILVVTLWWMSLFHILPPTYLARTQPPPHSC